MLTKKEIIIMSATLIAVFAVGRYTAPTKTITETKEVVVEKIVKQIEYVKDEHVRTIIVYKKNPDGSEETKTEIIKDTTQSGKSTELSQKENKKSSLTETYKDGSITNVSILARSSVSDPFNISMGLSYSKELLGPITVGAFGFLDKTIGVTIGLNF